MADLTNATKTIRVMNAVAAGVTDQNSSIVDMKGFEGVRFIALFGALTATQVTQIKVQQDTDAAGGTMADLAGTNTGPLADGDGNKMLVTEIVRPRERYVRCVVDRGTANAVIDGVIAELFGPGTEPVTKDSSVAFQEVSLAPAEGTA